MAVGKGPIGKRHRDEQEGWMQPARRDWKARIAEVLGSRHADILPVLAHRRPTRCEKLFGFGMTGTTDRVARRLQGAH